MQNTTTRGEYIQRNERTIGKWIDCGSNWIICGAYDGVKWPPVGYAEKVQGGWRVGTLTQIVGTVRIKEEAPALVL